jgi:hypothetical protein
MKKEYIKPSAYVLTFASDFMEGEIQDNSGVGYNPFAKETSFEEEETGIPTKFSNIWGDEEDED